MSHIEHTRGMCLSVLSASLLDSNVIDVPFYVSRVMRLVDAAEDGDMAATASDLVGRVRGGHG